MTGMLRMGGMGWMGGHNHKKNVEKETQNTQPTAHDNVKNQATF